MSTQCLKITKTASEAAEANFKCKVQPPSFETMDLYYGILSCFCSNETFLVLSNTVNVGRKLVFAPSDAIVGCW